MFLFRERFIPESVQGFCNGGVDALEYTVLAAERIGTTTPVGAFWLIDREGTIKPLPGSKHTVTP
jgi:hypothetical protein